MVISVRVIEIEWKRQMELVLRVHFAASESRNLMAPTSARADTIRIHGIG